MDRWLTKAEVSERIRRPIATLNYWRAMGTGPKSSLIGGRVLYNEAELNRWIKKQMAADDTYSGAAS
jgi:Helix-turn-helix domain